MPASAAEPEYDLLVRGGGPVGCTLALAMRGCGLRVALLQASAPAASFRPIALSYASRLILERVGAWHAVAATPIKTVHVSQQGGFGRTRMDAADAGVPALGYVASYAALLAALQTEVKSGGIDLVSAEVDARCTVHAEGSSPEAEETRYAQDAVIGIVRLATPPDATAFERFTPEGPLALLPFGEAHALIWSARPETARSLAEMDETQFLRRLAASAGRRVGLPVAVEGRAVQPLVLRVRPARVAARAVYIGNAAQTLHPVAGQGLNLGLRDAWDLAQILRESGDPGDAAVLSRYASRRSLDALATIRVTDLLARGFLGSGRVARSARSLALCALDILPGPRRFFARRMIYGPSALP
jgi:2-octaprenyl-6-methoxyphenol hydroxylase